LLEKTFPTNSAQKFTIINSYKVIFSLELFFPKIRQKNYLWGLATQALSVYVSDGPMEAAALWPISLPAFTS
jgi:hypothetical protein